MSSSLSETWMFSVVFRTLCTDFLVSQTSRSVVPDTWSSRSKTTVTKTTGNTSDSAVSPRRGPEGASRTFSGETNIVSHIGRYFAWQHLVYQAGNLEFNSSSDWQPMKLTQYRCDVFATFRSCDQPCRRILHWLYLPHEFVGHSVQQRVAVVQATWNECLELVSL